MAAFFYNSPTLTLSILPTTNIIFCSNIPLINFTLTMNEHILQPPNPRYNFNVPNVEPQCNCALATVVTPYNTPTMIIHVQNLKHNKADNLAFPATRTIRDSIMSKVSDTNKDPNGPLRRELQTSQNCTGLQVLLHMR